MVGGLTQPIFDGGRILGNFELTKARQDELLQTYRKTVVQAFADVDNALVVDPPDHERLRLQREVVARRRGGPSNCPSSNCGLEPLTS